MLLQLFQNQELVDWLQYPPGSTFLILAISIGVTLLSTVLNRLLIDPKRMQEKQAIIKDHKDKRKELEELKDVNPKKYKKEITKWERQDKAIQKMQQKMSLERLKPSCITIVPILIMFSVIRNFFGTGPVAIPPMNPWDIPQLGSMMWGTIHWVGLGGSDLGYCIPKEWGMINFTAWYFLCSFTFNTIIQKLAGTSTGSTGLGGFDQIFEQAKYDQYKTK